MSILIKDMDMPNDCSECWMWADCELLKDFPDYESVLFAVRDENMMRPTSCPLIEIPVPHGQLIDIEELWQLRPPLKTPYQIGKEEYNSGYNQAIDDFYSVLLNLLEHGVIKF